VLQELRAFGEPALLVADYITPPVAEKLRAQGVAFVDTAGNAWLDHPPLLVWVKGQKPTAKPARVTTGRAFQPGGLQVVFALLCNPTLIDQPYRDLAKLAGVAHGTVGFVMADLQELGYLQVVGEGRAQRRLLDPKRLLAPWAEAYARTLRPRTLIGRYYAPTIDDWKQWPVAACHALWGGEPAAAWLTDYLNPGELTLYVDKLPPQLVAKQRLTRTPGYGQTGVVDFRGRFWNFDADEPRADCAPPVLVYADLLATGDARCIETAQLVYDRHIARLFAAT
jgi:hypothetical protein